MGLIKSPCRFDGLHRQEPVIRELSSLSVAGKRVFLRCDLNVPLADKGEGERVITDDGRIRASLPTIEALLSNGAGIVICAHLGRPKGERKSELSLRPIANRLSQLLNRPVTFAEDVVGPSAKAAVANLAPGSIVLLENIRFEAAETSKDESERQALAVLLASFADIYIGDGFGAVVALFSLRHGQGLLCLAVEQRDHLRIDLNDLQRHFCSQTCHYRLIPALRHFKFLRHGAHVHDVAVTPNDNLIRLRRQVRHRP